MIDYPADLPHMIEYRVGKTVRTALPRTPVRHTTQAICNAAIVCPTIPHGCDGWRRVGETEWRPLSELPAHWMPFLNRARRSEMDPRR